MVPCGETAMNSGTVTIPVSRDGKGEQLLLGAMANRHGLIAGATGTGKTVTLRVLAEGLSAQGVPVFLADVKGDLAGIGLPGSMNEKIQERLTEFGIQNFSFAGSPVAFWDVFGQQGHPVRTTISDMGPMLLSRLLELNETQTAVLTLVFKLADEHGLLLLDLKDLEAVLQYVGEHSKELGPQYGNLSKQSVGAIQRGVITLGEGGGRHLFGEPALIVDDLMRTESDGRGVINILAADKLLQAPATYATFLLWLLSELFETLPEVGDAAKPKLAFFFDEAHLLFDDAPKALRDKIEQLVRLIRSKGVGVYFVTQNPLDIPEDVLGQLGNRVQHALRAFTPKDEKAVKSAARTFRSDGTIQVEKVITELAVGEALVSLLDENGTPKPVARSKILPPRSRLGTITADERRAMIQGSQLFGKYETLVDRESAFEKLTKKQEPSGASSSETKSLPTETEPAARKSTRQSPLEAFVSSTARSIGSQLGRALMRGVMGSLLGGTKSRR